MSQNGSWRSGASPWIHSGAAARDSAPDHGGGRPYEYVRHPVVGTMDRQYAYSTKQLAT